MFWSRNIWTKDISWWKVKISCLRIFIWMFRRTVKISFFVEFSVWFDMIMILNRKNIWFWLISLYFLILWHGHLSKLVKISSILLHNFQNCVFRLQLVIFHTKILSSKCVCVRNFVKNCKWKSHKIYVKGETLDDQYLVRKWA